MADFDNFEGANQAEEDPAAEFLAREQSEMAGLEDDNFSGQQQDGFDAFEGGQVAESVPEEQNDFLGGGMGGGLDTSESGVTLTGDALITTESPANYGGGLFDNGSESTPVGVFSQPVTNGPSDAYSAISQVDSMRAEPEKIRLWREEQKTRLENKDAEEETKKGDWNDVAKKELDDWYKHHADQLDKTKENNRVSEHAFIKERDESVPGAQWEKICRLCEFNPKNMKSSKDVTRMRSLLLQLKQSPLVR